MFELFCQTSCGNFYQFDLCHWSSSSNSASSSLGETILQGADSPLA